MHQNLKSKVGWPFVFFQPKSFVIPQFFFVPKSFAATKFFVFNFLPKVFSVIPLSILTFTFPFTPKSVSIFLVISFNPKVSVFIFLTKSFFAFAPPIWFFIFTFAPTAVFSVWVVQPWYSLTVPLTFIFPVIRVVVVIVGLRVIVFAFKLIEASTVIAVFAVTRFVFVIVIGLAFFFVIRRVVFPRQFFVTPVICLAIFVIR